MQVQQLLRIAGVGVLVTVISQILTRAGREDIATMTTIAGLVIVLMMVVTLVALNISFYFSSDFILKTTFFMGAGCPFMMATLCASSGKHTINCPGFK